MSYYKNLVPGQMQIGNIVMGYGTNIKIEHVEINPDDINAQDYQVARTDENRFGIDNFKPTTIEFTFQVLHNRMLPDWAEYISNFWHNMPHLKDLRNEWRFDEGRKKWGEMKHIFICSKLDGVPKVIFGRPGQFKYEFDDEINGGEIVKAVAEYRRADTVAYSALEYVTPVAEEEEPVTIVRSNGDVDTWVRIIGEGPITDPVITIGNQQVKLDITVPSGEFFEISSYPWQRRAVDSNRVNLAANMVGDTKFLDKIRLPPNTNTPIRWTSDDFNTFVPDIANDSWQEDINEINQRNLPDTFTNVYGKVVVRFDLFNYPKFGSNFIAAGILGSRAACLYNKSEFNGYNQQSQATITEAFLGRSGIVIMSNSSMTNYVILEVKSAFGDNWLRIRTGTSPSAYSSVRAEWENEAFFGWKETDVVGIKATYVSGHIKYEALFNGVVKATWTDSGDVVNKANRRQGYIFDMDGNIFTTGTGFKDLVSFDHGTVPSPTGKMYFLWRDAYSVI